MPYDLTRCPQTEQEFTEYFFSLIGRQLGGSANDWNWVLRESGIPPGFGPGVKADASYPYFGLTQQWSSGPKARIFLPTAIPDENGYYTRCIQYIKDTPGGVQGQDFTWAWDYVAGHAYSPVQGTGEPVPTPEPEPTPPPTTIGLELRVLKNTADIEHLTAIVQQQHQQIEKLELGIQSAAKKGDAVEVRVGRNYGHGHAATGTIL